MTPSHRYNSLCKPVSKFILPPSSQAADPDSAAADELAAPGHAGPPKPDYINTPEGASLVKQTPLHFKFFRVQKCSLK